MTKKLKVYSPFQASVSLPYPLKTENLRFCYVLRGVRWITDLKRVKLTEELSVFLCVFIYFKRFIASYT